MSGKSLSKKLIGAGNADPVGTLFRGISTFKKGMLDVKKTVAGAAGKKRGH